MAVTIKTRFMPYSSDDTKRILAKADAERFAYTDISIAELTAGTLGAATKEKLIAMRQNGQSGDVVMLIKGETYVPAVLQAYGSAFIMYFLDNNGTTARLGKVTADASNNNWSVTLTDLVTATDIANYSTTEQITEALAGKQDAMDEATEEEVRNIVKLWSPDTDNSDDSSEEEA